MHVLKKNKVTRPKTVAILVGLSCILAENASLAATSKHTAWLKKLRPYVSL